MPGDRVEHRHRLIQHQQPRPAGQRQGQRELRLLAPRQPARRPEAKARLLVRAAAGDPVPPGWEARPVGLEELALAYLREPGAAALPGPPRTMDAETTEVPA